MVEISSRSKKTGEDLFPGYNWIKELIGCWTKREYSVTFPFWESTNIHSGLSPTISSSLPFGLREVCCSKWRQGKKLESKGMTQKQLTSMIQQKDYQDYYWLVTWPYSKVKSYQHSHSSVISQNCLNIKNSS